MESLALDNTLQDNYLNRKVVTVEVQASPYEIIQCYGHKNDTDLFPELKKRITRRRRKQSRLLRTTRLRKHNALGPYPSPDVNSHTNRSQNVDIEDVRNMKITLHECQLVIY